MGRLREFCHLMRSLGLPPPSSDRLQHAAAVPVESALHRILRSAHTPQTTSILIPPMHWNTKFIPRIILKHNKHRHWSWVYEDLNAILDTLMLLPVFVVPITRRYLRSPVRWRRWKFYICRSEIVFWRHRNITHHLRHRKWRPACKEVQMNLFSVS